ncbi:hypothetical protein [Bradyrhizobium japonicum]|uniref:hypothetical protein n=1 Tax=Bradyrhizobium japonicum TaxID=375 RepID=UPI0012FD2AE2|nr:hypothetical protein [Bradyrhizobium japonicum]
MASIDRLKSHLLVMPIGSMDHSKVSRLFSLVREVMEETERPQRGALPLLCDWTLHTKLDRKGARDTINQIQSHFTAEIERGERIGTDDNAEHILEAIGFRTVGDELKAFFRRHNCRNTIIGGPLEPLIVAHLFDDLRDKPLLRPEEDVEKAIKEATTRFVFAKIAIVHDPQHARFGRYAVQCDIKQPNGLPDITLLKGMHVF